MAKRHLINEDKLPPKLPVIITDEIKNEIEVIKEYNQFERDGLLKLDSYIKWITNHLSNRAIAFDYGNKFTMDSYGTIIIKDMGVTFCLENDSEKVFVKILWININLEEYGLEAPPPLYENKQHNTNCLKESELKRMIDETVRRVMEERRNRRLNESVGESFRKVLKEHLMNNYTKL